MTRVLFDGYWWAQGPGANRMVMRELINAWSRHHPEDELIIAVRHRHRDQVGDVPADVQLTETRLWPQAASNVVELPMLARRHRADVVVCHNYAPIAGPSVVFVHDLLFRDHPEWFSRAERAYFNLMPVTLPRASTVVTSSETESGRIRRITRRRDVPAVGLAVPRELADCAPEPVPLAHERFALIVGRLNVRKNLATAIEAAGLASAIDASCPLLVVGDTRHSGISMLPDHVQRAAADGAVTFLGHVTNGQLRWLYQRALVTLCLSLDEGFGMPPLEAAYFGSPLIVSDIPVFRETVGAVAELVDPLDAPAVATAIDAACARSADERSARHRHELGYSWSATAAALRQAALGVAPGAGVPADSTSRSGV